MRRRKLSRTAITQCVIACVVALAALSACPGDFGRRDGRTPVPDSAPRFDQGPLPDITNPTFDTGPKLDGPSPDAPPTDQGVACSAAGTPAQCQPKDGSGCGANASCYLVTTSGPACVCPAGAKAEGASCNTTVECQPGLACAGDSAPGKCAKLCDPAPAANTCGGARKCTPFTPFPKYGACI